MSQKARSYQLCVEHLYMELASGFCAYQSDSNDPWVKKKFRFHLKEFLSPIFPWVPAYKPSNHIVCFFPLFQCKSILSREFYYALSPRLLPTLHYVRLPKKISERWCPIVPGFARFFAACNEITKNLATLNV